MKAQDSFGPSGRAQDEQDVRGGTALAAAAPSGLRVGDLYETRDGRRVLLTDKSDDGGMFYGRLPDGRVVGWKADGSTPPDSTGRKEYPSDIVWKVGLIPVERAAPSAEVWRDPDTGREVPKPAACSVDEAREALGLGDEEPEGPTSAMLDAHAKLDEVLRHPGVREVVLMQGMAHQTAAIGAPTNLFEKVTFKWAATVGGAALADMERDAERYRYLRVHSTGPMDAKALHRSPESLDRAVDACMAAVKEQR